jgi:dipeptidyl aminopeptidase/acylaminoacyl peptidase
MPQTKPLDLEQLIRIPSVADYALSPDGQTAAVVWDKSGQWEIYLLPAKGRGKARQITSGPESKLAPEFSPDGAHLAFVQDYSGNECFDLFVYDLRTGQARNLTPDTPDEMINPNVSWSPDGRQIAFVSNRQGGFATYVLDVAEPAAVRRLTHHDYSDYAAEWSPDGRWLAVTAQVRGQETWVFVVPAGGGKPRIVGGPDGPVDASYPRWSPDGKRLAFTSNSPGIYTVFTYDLDSGALTRQTEPTHEAGDPAWSPDGARLAFTWNEDGNVGIGLKGLATGAIRYVRVAPGVHGHPRFTPDGRRLLFLYDGPRHPDDLWALDLKTKRVRQLTRSLPKSLTGREFVAPEVVRWPSDGLTISGFLYKPRRFKRGKSPAVLYVHGGPTWQFQNTWLAPLQHLVSLGFVVLAPNYRGSTGYGRAFQEANRFDLGGGDMRDVIAGAGFVVRQGYADPQRIAITGASYGGYLTLTALTRHPRVFAAGSAVVPFLNWFTEHANERADLQYWDLQNFGDPVQDADRYREYSPIFFLENIVAPVQLIAGAHDPRCPASETEQAAAALREMGVPHEVIIYPDEGHGFRKMSNRVDAHRRRAMFLSEQLGLAEPRSSDRPARRRAKPAQRAPAARVLARSRPERRVRRGRERRRST